MNGMNKTSMNGKSTNDEYYTRYEDVDAMLSTLNLNGLKVYCPCDGEESQFVRWLKEHNIEYRNTADNYWLHEDLYEWADIIITNPPFRGESKWIRWLLDSGRTFCLVCPSMAVSIAHDFFKNFWDGPVFHIGMLTKFMNPEGKLCSVKCTWALNFKDPNDIKGTKNPSVKMSPQTREEVRILREKAKLEDFSKRPNGQKSSYLFDYRQET